MLRQRGFTLVELVMVIVLLGIVATISTQFVSLSVRGAIDLGDRQQRALQGVVISEQITREIREAFPLSVRAEPLGCLEWLPILGGTTYESLPFDEEKTTFSITSFSDDAREAINDDDQEARLVVYGYGVPKNELYNYDSDPGPVSPKVISINDGKVTLSSGHRFTQRSPQKRIYAIGQPISICQKQNGVSKRLVRFSAYPATTQPSFRDLSSEESGVMSANLWPDSLRFNVRPASLQRSALVDFAFELVAPNSDERTRVSQEVQIRNVP
ncbi:PulJ/GspJ family protein [Marinobacter gelidimuriae]|uniref:PulJ/GspJ family protein n=1 Tax=Marinobacter gelidimuriae TaxID=2739064 RepID=UPI0003647099|nr:type II secretion system protein [Marinobacter gelidimuriae]